MGAWTKIRRLIADESLFACLDAYTLEDLVFRWRTDVHPVELSPTISLPEYTITNVSYVVCQKAFSSTGEYSDNADYRVLMLLTSTILP